MNAQETREQKLEKVFIPYDEDRIKNIILNAKNSDQIEFICTHIEKYIEEKFELETEAEIIEFLTNLDNELKADCLIETK